jgi:hypothetical protein
MMPLKKMLDGYIGRRTDLKEWSIKMLRQTRDKLVSFFGENRLIGTITAANPPISCDSWERTSASRTLRS